MAAHAGTGSTSTRMRRCVHMQVQSCRGSRRAYPWPCTILLLVGDKEYYTIYYYTILGTTVTAKHTYLYVVLQSKLARRTLLCTTYIAWWLDPYSLLIEEFFFCYVLYLVFFALSPLLPWFSRTILYIITGPGIFSFSALISSANWTNIRSFGSVHLVCGETHLDFGPLIQLIQWL